MAPSVGKGGAIRPANGGLTERQWRKIAPLWPNPGPKPGEGWMSLGRQSGNVGRDSVGVEDGGALVGQWVAEILDFRKWIRRATIRCRRSAYREAIAFR